MARFTIPGYVVEQQDETCEYDDIQVDDYGYTIYLTQMDEVAGKPFEAIVLLSRLQFKQLAEKLGFEDSTGLRNERAQEPN